MYLGIVDIVRNQEIYECTASELNITVKKYHENTGVSKATLFTDDLNKRNQTLSYSGVGTHSQKGVAERTIHTIVTSARIMMLHQALMWPPYFDIRLWPFALEHASDIWNYLPDARFNVDAGLALIKIYTSTKVGTICLPLE